MDVDVSPTVPLPAKTLSRWGVTDDRVPSNLSHMGKAWPVAEFREYLRALMDAAGIANYAELSRLTGVSQNQFSNWHRGLAQPSRDSLAKIAPALNTPPVNLWIAAGLAGPEELNLDALPDMRVLPQEFRDLIVLYEDSRTNDGVRAFLRRSVAALVAGVKAEATKQGRPTSRRRTG